MSSPTSSATQPEGPQLAVVVMDGHVITAYSDGTELVTTPVEVCASGERHVVTATLQRLIADRSPRPVRAVVAATPQEQPIEWIHELGACGEACTRRRK